MTVKQNLVVVILLLFILFGLFLYKNQREQIRSHAIIKQIKILEKTNNALNDENHFIIFYRKGDLEQYPNLEILMDRMEKVRRAKTGLETILNTFYHRVVKIENPYFDYNKNDKSDHFTMKKQSAFAFNPNLGKIKKHYSKKITASFLSYKNELNSIIKDTTHLEFIGNRFLNRMRIDLQNQLDSSLNLTIDFQDESQLQKHLKTLDFAHLMWLIKGSIQELHLVEAQLLQTYSTYFEQLKIAPFTNTGEIIVMSPDNEPREGEVFKSYFWVNSYVYLDSMEMSINGQEIPIENGRGSYYFTPKSKGMKLFKTTISAQNPYTDKSDHYKRIFKLKVY